MARGLAERAERRSGCHPASGKALATVVLSADEFLYILLGRQNRSITAEKAAMTLIGRRLR